MVRMIIHGCNGAMGQVITGLATDDKDIEIVADIDLRQEIDYGYPVFTSLEECSVGMNVIVDFVSAKAVDGFLKFSVETGTPVILYTTGLSQEQLAAVKRASASATVLRSTNMSLSVNLLFKLVQNAARVLASSGFDIEIVEKHHNQEMDAPSGTAIALANSMNGAMGGSHEYIYDRSGKREKRSPKEIGTSTVRGGSIVEEHDVIFAGRDEVVTFSYTAYSKAIFAKGVLEAAKFLASKGPRLYTMTDVVRL